MVSDEMLDREAIKELLGEYCFRLDHLRFAEWAELFTEDGVFAAHSRGRVQGRANIRAFMESIVPLPHEGPARKHYVANTIIDLRGETADVKCYFLMMRQGDDGVLVGGGGCYYDKVVKVNGSWLFKEREVTLELKGHLGTKI